ncbi:MAG: thioredoxin family protein [Thermodesulfobacteriota bacterium]
MASPFLQRLASLALAVCPLLPFPAAALAAPIANGDLVALHYTIRLADGQVAFTSRPEVDRDAGLAKAPWYRPRPGLTPEEILVGAGELLPGLDRALVGRSMGERATLTLPPEEGFGLPDEKLRRQLPLVKRLPRSIGMNGRIFLDRFGKLPQVGDTPPLGPYVKARVSAVGGDLVTMDVTAEDGQVVEDELGTARVQVTEQEIEIRLEPKLGAILEIEGQPGRIVSVTGDLFTVDLNPPWLGQTVTVDYEVVSVQPAASLAGPALPWVEDHDAGLAAAAAGNRPAILVLYADWCQYCKRLFAETLEDPRIKAMAERYVWIKVNSDQLTQYKEHYKQEGFPLVVLLDAQGREKARLDGFKPAMILKAAIEAALVPAATGG